MLYKRTAEVVGDGYKVELGMRSLLVSRSSRFRTGKDERGHVELLGLLGEQ
jgi:hypothetical protein